MHHRPDLLLVSCGDVGWLDFTLFFHFFGFWIFLGFLYLFFSIFGFSYFLDFYFSIFIYIFFDFGLLTIYMLGFSIFWIFGFLFFGVFGSSIFFGFDFFYREGKSCMKLGIRKLCRWKPWQLDPLCIPEPEDASSLHWNLTAPGPRFLPIAFKCAMQGVRRRVSVLSWDFG